MQPVTKWGVEKVPDVDKYREGAPHHCQRRRILQINIFVGWRWRRPGRQFSANLYGVYQKRTESLACAGWTFGGGAGSGRLTYKSKMEVSPGTVLTARVGGKRQQTNLTFSAGDPCPSIERDCIKLSRGRGKKVYVMPGGDTRGVNGGWGYSGGGGDGMAVYTEFQKLRPKSRYIRGAPGGSNGGAAPNTARRGNRGGGSGKDISSYTFNTWTLTPGAGGTPYSRYDPLPKCPFSQCRNSPNQSYGGGGGGVLVNGAGPKASKHQGQGYGGGGSGANRVNIPGYNWRYGYAGVDVPARCHFIRDRDLLIVMTSCLAIDMTSCLEIEIKLIFIINCIIFSSIILEIQISSSGHPIFTLKANCKHCIT